LWVTEQSYMAEVQQPLPVEAPLAQTPNMPGSVTDLRDGITVESNTGTTDELAKGLDALDKAIDAHADAVEKGTINPPTRDPTGKFTSKARRHSAVARMEDATAKEAAAKRERDAVTAENARLKAQLAERAQPAAPPPTPQPPRLDAPPADPEPDPHDLAKYPAGEYDPRFLRDVGRYEARQEFQRQRAVEVQQQQAEHHLRTVEHGMSAYAAKMQQALPEGQLEAFLKELPPAILNLRPSAVQAMIAPQAPLGPSNVVADCISDAENPVALMRHLKDHPAVFQRLLTLHPIQVFREMGRIEASLAAATPVTRSAPREPQVSRARPPVQRVESVPQMSDAPPGDDASDEEHAAYYNRRELQRRFGRG
jgi:hypothetical protein